MDSEKRRFQNQTEDDEILNQKADHSSDTKETDTDSSLRNDEMDMNDIEER